MGYKQRMYETSGTNMYIYYCMYINSLIPPTLQLVSYLHFQHRPLSFTGSLGVGCESLLKVKVKDSVGLRPYSQLECSAAQLTESKGKGQCGPRRELRVKVKTSKTPAADPTTYDNH